MEFLVLNLMCVTNAFCRGRVSRPAYTLKFLVLWRIAFDQFFDIELKSMYNGISRQK